MKSIINRLTTGVIKLRTGCLYSKYKTHAWECAHHKNASKTIRLWKRLQEWRDIWSKRFNAINWNMEYTLLKLKYYKALTYYFEAPIITNLINEATETMIKAYC